MDLADVERLTESDAPTVSYGSHRKGGFGCGYIGYQHLKLTGMTDKTKDSFARAFKLLQQKIDEDPNIQGKMSVFVYSKKYDWRKHGIALQFNENWVEDSVRFGVTREHVRLESFVEYPDSIIRNWRDSPIVKPLDVKLPEIPIGHKQAWTKTPAEVDSTKCRFLIIPNRDFDEYVFPENGQQVFEILEGNLRQHKKIDGEWQVQVNPIVPEESESRPFGLEMLSLKIRDLLAEIDSKFSSTQQLNGKSYIFQINESELKNMPCWNPESPNPPVSARAARRIAQEQCDKLFPNPSPYVMTYSSQALEPLGNDKWIWRVTFRRINAQDLLTFNAAKIALIVGMDGYPVRTKIR